MKLLLVFFTIIISGTAAHAIDLQSGLYVPDQDTCRYRIIVAPNGIVIKRVAATWTRYRHGIEYRHTCYANGAIVKPNSDGTYTGKLRYAEGKYSHIVVYPLNKSQMLVEYRTPNFDITPEQFLKDLSAGTTPLFKLYRGK